jgi:hypothetical protein
MKAIIKSVVFKKEWESKFGPQFTFEIKYDDKKAYYNSKSKDQKKFVEGQEFEFTEETRDGKNGPYLVVKPIYVQGQSNYGKSLKREQSKYSGFAMAYAKDLYVAGKIQSMEQMYAEAQAMIDWMVAADKEIGS